MSDEKKPSRAELGERAFVGLGGRTTKVLAHGGHTWSRHLTLDDRYVYWTDGQTGEVSRIPKTGGIPMVLATVDAPKFITHVEGYLYWAQKDPKPADARPWERVETGRVVRMPVDGGEIEVVAARLEGPHEVAVSGRDVAISCNGRYDHNRKEEVVGLIVRATLGEAKHRVVAREQRWPKSLAFVGDDLYWLNYGWKWPDYFADGALMRMKRNGDAQPEAVCERQYMANSLLVDDGCLYWSTRSLERLPRDGGPRESIRLPGADEGALLAHDATHVYWLSHGWGSMVRVSKSDGSVEPMMRFDERKIVIAESIAVDEHRVYWTVHDGPGTGGAVWSIAKEPVGARVADEPATEPAN
jgi:hypothetical protein